MEEKKDSFQEIVDRWNKEQEARYGKFEPRSKPTVKTGRESKALQRIPQDTDFIVKEGNTEYEVVGHFNENSRDYLLNQILRRLKNSQAEN